MVWQKPEVVQSSENRAANIEVQQVVPAAESRRIDSNRNSELQLNIDMKKAQDDVIAPRTQQYLPNMFAQHGNQRPSSGGHGSVGSASAVASPHYQPNAQLVDVDKICPHLGFDLQGRIPQFSSQAA